MQGFSHHFSPYTAPPPAHRSPAGSAMDAALNDPRWLAREAAGQVTAR